VVDDGGGDVEEIGLVGVVAAGEAEVAQGDVAEQPQVGRLEADADAGELLAEAGEGLLAQGGGGGPAPVGAGAGPDGGDGGKDEAADQPLAPGAGGAGGRRCADGGRFHGPCPDGVMVPVGRPGGGIVRTPPAAVKRAWSEE